MKRSGTGELAGERVEASPDIRSDGRHHLQPTLQLQVGQLLVGVERRKLGRVAPIVTLADLDQVDRSRLDLLAVDDHLERVADLDLARMERLDLMGRVDRSRLDLDRVACPVVERARVGCERQPSVLVLVTLDLDRVTLDLVALDRGQPCILLAVPWRPGGRRLPVQVALVLFVLDPVGQLLSIPVVMAVGPSTNEPAAASTPSRRARGHRSTAPDASLGVEPASGLDDERGAVFPDAERSLLLRLTLGRDGVTAE